MGLNDLTLEKLVSEINGYKEKMRAIHEDYGRASQDLQDRINVLGYNLNEHLRQTKDQISNTPQRLLNLETKYVTGEVDETEYRKQREEFKGLLDRNLQSIDEIKNMIGVLQQIQVRPLAPAEFKQTAPLPSTAPVVPKVIGEEWGRGAFSRDSFSAAPQPPTQAVSTPQIGPRFTFETPANERTTLVESSPQQSSPSPPQPQSNGTNWSSPAPSSNAATPSTSSFEQPIEPLSSPVLAPAEVGTSTLSDSSTIGDEALTSVPTIDIVDTGADDSLMVKVVDDVPVLGGSAAVVTDSSAELQPTVLGSPDTSTVAPAAPDLAQTGLTPPSQFYRVVCPKCGAEVPKPAKVWELKGGKSKKNVLIGLFQCQDCRVKFREALTREII